MMKSRNALQHLIESLIGKIEKIMPSAKPQVARSLEEILEWHKKRGTVFPEWVREGDTQDDAVQEVDLSKDQDRLRLMEEEYERMLGTRNPKKEVEWTRFDRRSIKASALGSVAVIKGMPALYPLKQAVSERGFSASFSTQLLISENLLSTFVGESNCLLTENQKPVHRILFIAWLESTAVLISEGDARLLKEHLLNLGDEEGKGIYLIEPSGAINQRGCRREEIVNLWRQGTLKTRSILFQVLCFQGSAMMIDSLPENEVKEALQFWIDNDADRMAAARVIFESALDLKPDDMLHYRRSQKLSALFNFCTSTKNNAYQEFLDFAFECVLS